MLPGLQRVFIAFKTNFRPQNLRKIEGLPLRGLLDHCKQLHSIELFGYFASDADRMLMEAFELGNGGMHGFKAIQLDVQQLPSERMIRALASGCASRIEYVKLTATHGNVSETFQHVLHHVPYVKRIALSSTSCPEPPQAMSETESCKSPIASYEHLLPPTLHRVWQPYARLSYLQHVDLFGYEWNANELWDLLQCHRRLRTLKVYEVRVDTATLVRGLWRFLTNHQELEQLQLCFSTPSDTKPFAMGTRLVEHAITTCSRMRCIRFFGLLFHATNTPMVPLLQQGITMWDDSTFEWKRPSP
jgi:hypothetical protein